MFLFRGTFNTVIVCYLPVLLSGSRRKLWKVLGLVIALRFLRWKLLLVEDGQAKWAASLSHRVELAHTQSVKGCVCSCSAESNFSKVKTPSPVPTEGYCLACAPCRVFLETFDMVQLETLVRKHVLRLAFKLTPLVAVWLLHTFLSLVGFPVVSTP